MGQRGLDTLINGGLMGSPKRVPWAWVTDELMPTWSAMELILSAEHELVQKATQAFCYAHALGDQGGYDFSSEGQQQLIMRLYPLTEHFLGVSYWMTIWLLAQEGKKPRLIPMVERHVRQQELVPQWTAEELIANVYAELAQESLSA